MSESELQAERDAAIQRAARLELSEIAWRKVLEECKRALSIADTYESNNWNGNIIGVGVEVSNALHHLRDERDAASTERAALTERLQGVRSELAALAAAAASARALAYRDAQEIIKGIALGLSPIYGSASGGVVASDAIAQIEAKIRALSPQRAAGSEA